jgi:diacylglycerol kinase (ATP)
MRICLLVNKGAGTAVSTDELRTAIERSGHEIAHIVDKDDHLRRVLDEPVDILVAAGGDGTVWRAANALVGRNISLAVLPMGTANNIALSLGIDGPIERLVERWSNGHHRPLDLGLLHGSPADEHFIEGIGAGLIPGGIAAMHARHESEEGDADERVRLALQTYLEVLADLQPQRWTLTVDGTRLEDELLLLEVLNMRSIGPNIVLSESVDASDGWLSVVTAGEEHRQQIVDYLEGRIEGRNSRLDLPTRRAREVEIQAVDHIHIDDEVHHREPGQVVSLVIQPAAVRVIV